MTFELLPLTAFALQSSGLAADAMGCVHTLTLRPDAGDRSESADQLRGTVTAGAWPAADGGLHTGVGPDMQPALTISF